MSKELKDYSFCIFLSDRMIEENLRDYFFEKEGEERTSSSEENEQLELDIKRLEENIVKALGKIFSEVSAEEGVIRVDDYCSDQLEFLERGLDSDGLVWDDFEDNIFEGLSALGEAVIDFEVSFDEIES